jgi:hypothetical protein
LAVAVLGRQGAHRAAEKQVGTAIALLTEAVAKEDRTGSAAALRPGWADADVALTASAF